MDTVRTEKMKRLYEITNDLLNEMVKEKQIELSKYLEPQACKTLTETPFL